MANYNTFVCIDCNKRKTILVTSSARKAKTKLYVGFKIEIWNNNIFIETIYHRQLKNLNKYIEIEKQYIKDKQLKSTLRNQSKRIRRHKKNEKYQD